MGIFAVAFYLIIFIVYDEHSIKAELFFGIMYASIILFGLIVRGGTVIFEEEGFIIKKTLFHSKKYFEYDNIEKIELLFYPTGGGRYGAGEPSVVIYFKKVKSAQVILEIQYQLIRTLLEKKTSRSQIKIEFYSLRIFSEKYRELLKDYLTGRQKEDIQRMIAQKESRRKKRTNK